MIEVSDEEKAFFQKAQKVMWYGTLEEQEEMCKTLYEYFHQKHKEVVKKELSERSN